MGKLNVSMDMFGNTKGKEKKEKKKRKRKCYYEVFKSKLASKHMPCLLVSIILSFFLLFSLFLSKYLFFDTMTWKSFELNKVYLLWHIDIIILYIVDVI